jgi:hypothetical protein
MQALHWGPPLRSDKGRRLGQPDRPHSRMFHFRPATDVQYSTSGYSLAERHTLALPRPPPQVFGGKRPNPHSGRSPRVGNSGGKQFLRPRPCNKCRPEDRK